MGRVSVDDGSGSSQSDLPKVTVTLPCCHLVDPKRGGGAKEGIL